MRGRSGPWGYYTSCSVSFLRFYFILGKLGFLHIFLTFKIEYSIFVRLEITRKYSCIELIKWLKIALESQMYALSGWDGLGLRFFNNDEIFNVDFGQNMTLNGLIHF